MDVHKVHHSSEHIWGGSVRVLFVLKALPRDSSTPGWVQPAATPASMFQWWFSTSLTPSTLSAGIQYSCYFLCRSHGSSSGHRKLLQDDLCVPLRWCHRPFGCNPTLWLFSCPFASGTTLLSGTTKSPGPPVSSLPSPGIGYFPKSPGLFGWKTVVRHRDLGAVKAHVFEVSFYVGNVSGTSYLEMNWHLA